MRDNKLDTLLAGTSDDCLHMSWHPQRSCFVTVGTSGKIYVWAQVYKENWSAFAPDFQELVENQVTRFGCCCDLSSPCSDSPWSGRTALQGDRPSRR